jgi:hypothetical protein
MNVIHKKFTENISENLKGRGHLEDLGIIWRVILRQIWEKYSDRLGSSGSG